MQNTLKEVLIGGLLLVGIPYVLGLLYEPLETIGPQSIFFIFQLAFRHDNPDPSLLLAICITVSAAVVAWAFSWFWGYWLGLFAASFVIDKAERFHYIGRTTNWAYKSIYVVPLVLTLNMAYGMLSQLRTTYLDFPQWLLALMMIAIAGAALGGYNIFESVYASVVKAKVSSLILCEGLYFRDEHLHTYGRSIYWKMMHARKLRDCEIMSYCESVTRAFHLALVSIVILETITPYFYENFYRQSGELHGWLGGVGYEVLSAQETYNFIAVAACIWSILFFDYLMVMFVSLGLYLKFRQPYGARSEA